LLRRIGGGAYGEVWLARSKATGVLRAAKIVSRHTFDEARPFEREFEGLQRFERISREHPSQLALFHIGRNDAGGYFYYVMELADNMGAADNYTPRTLRADLQHGRLSAERVLEIGLALTEALGHLHQNGLVHRDVKPSNVIFVNGRPKLADIGLLTDASDSRSIVGTEGYLPPEGPGTPQADIFAMGKVLYEAVTGLDRREFPKLPEDLRAWPDRASIVEFNEIVLRACASNAERRYRTCDEMHGELTLLAHGKSVKYVRTMRQCWVWFRKAGIAVSVLAAAATLISLWLRHPTRRFEASSDGPDSTNLEANALCDKGLNILRADSVAEFKAAYTDFNEAVVRDPNFARPYVGLLDLRAREYVPGIPAATTEVMRDIMQHLDTLAPDLPATHVVEAIVNWSDWHYPEAERCLWQATNANPNYELAHSWYSWLLECFGRPEEAYNEAMISEKLAPSKDVVYRMLGNVCYVQRKYTNAISRYNETLGWVTNHIQAYWSIGRSLQAMGKYPESLRYLETGDILSGADEATTKTRYESLRRALDLGGIAGYWQEMWSRAESDTNATFYSKAVIKMHLSDTNAALGLLEASYTNRERGTMYITPLNLLLYDDCWDGLHEHPRFKALLDEIGFTKVMRPKPKR
jgi:tetratricopeptide (TPR) repeat protein